MSVVLRRRIEPPFDDLTDLAVERVDLNDDDSSSLSSSLSSSSSSSSSSSPSPVAAVAAAAAAAATASGATLHRREDLRVFTEKSDGAAPPLASAAALLSRSGAFPSLAPTIVTDFRAFCFSWKPTAARTASFASDQATVSSVIFAQANRGSGEAEPPESNSRAQRRSGRRTD